MDATEARADRQQNDTAIPQPPSMTPAVAAAYRRYEDCQKAEKDLSHALTLVAAVYERRTRLGVGEDGARLGVVDTMVVHLFQKCGAGAVSDLYMLLAAVRQAKEGAHQKLTWAKSMAAFEQCDPAGDDPLLPADSEGGDL